MPFHQCIFVTCGAGAMQELLCSQAGVSVACNTASIAVLQEQTCLILEDGAEVKVVCREGLPPSFIAVDAAKLLFVLGHMRCRLLQQPSSKPLIYQPLLLTRKQHLMLLVMSRTRHFCKFINLSRQRYQRPYEALVAYVCSARASRLFLTIESQVTRHGKRSRPE